jgi:hypothetical protein
VTNTFLPASFKLYTSFRVQRFLNSDFGMRNAELKIIKTWFMGSGFWVQGSGFRGSGLK